MYRITWLAFCNLVIVALTICVLAGCRSNVEKNYGIINWHKSTLDLIWGEQCANVTADVIPDIYRLGSSGVCRIVDGKTSCQSRFPPSLNLARVVLEDIEQADLTGLLEATVSILDGCWDAINKPIDHSMAEKLGVAMISLLIVSIFINVISPFTAIVDEVWGLLTTLILCIAMMNYEGGGYLQGVHGRDFSDGQMMGVAVWLLVAMVIGRIVSNPWLVIKAIVVLLPIALAVGFVLIRARGLFLIIRVMAQTSALDAMA